MKTAITLTLALLLAAAGAFGLHAAGSDNTRAVLHEHLQALGAGIHGAGHHGGHAAHGHGHGSLAGLFEEGELSADQLAGLVAVDRAFVEFHHSAGSLRELHERLLKEYEKGATDGAALNAIVDEYFDRMRQSAHQVTNRMTRALGSLDPAQRGRVLQHLRGRGPSGNADAI